MKHIKLFDAYHTSNIESNVNEGKVKGLWTHTNTRKDKVDMFPQQELIDMLLSI
jgi:hypothetical protein